MELAYTLSSNGSICGFDSHRAHHVTPSPSGKAGAFEASMHWFESSRGCHDLRGIGVMVAQEPPNLLAEVRFLNPLPMLALPSVGKAADNRSRVVRFHCQQPCLPSSGVERLVEAEGVGGAIPSEGTINTCGNCEHYVPNEDRPEAGECIPNEWDTFALAKSPGCWKHKR